MPINVSGDTQRILVDPLSPSLEVGLVTGTAGAAIGAAVGLFKSRHPVAVATLVGISAFAYGSSTFYFRGAMLAALEERNKSLELGASGTAGILAGALIGASHGRASYARRSATTGGLLGLSSQFIYHSIIERYSMPRAKTSMTDRIAAWLPLQPLPDEQYEGVLNEKITRIDKELALLDERITNLRQQTDT